MKRAIGSPTKAQQAHQDAQRAMGCAVCCYRGRAGMQFGRAGPPEIHHRTVGDKHGQKQIGQDATVCLCSWHHRGIPLEGMTAKHMQYVYGPSFALHARDFREWTQDVIGERGTGAWQAWQDEIIGRKAA